MRRMGEQVRGRCGEGVKCRGEIRLTIFRVILSCLPPTYYLLIVMIVLRTVFSADTSAITGKVEPGLRFGCFTFRII